MLTLPFRMPASRSGPDDLNYRNGWRVHAEICEVKRSGGKFQRFLRGEVFAETLFVEIFELLDSFWSWLREERVMVWYGHKAGLTVKAANHRLGSRVSNRRLGCIQSTARAPCGTVSHADVLIPNAIV